MKYFYKKLYLFIKVNLDNQDYDLDLWEEVIEWAVNVEIKTSFKLSSVTKKINSRCLKCHKLAK